MRIDTVTPHRGVRHRHVEPDPHAGPREGRRSVRHQRKERPMTTMRRRYAVAVVLVLSLAGASLALAAGAGRNKGSEFHAQMIGYGEVPSLHSAAHATLAA